MSGALSVRKVETRRDFKAFFEFPWRIYKGDPNWVPPLLSQRRHLLDKKRNPTWEYLTGDYFVAWRGDEPVGTIAAFINHRHNEFWNEKIGWFGFFECIDDVETARALLNVASDYVRAAGPYTAIRGPANFTLNDECGLLIKNFEPPLILMPYNHPYYQSLIENSGLGFNKVMDTVSYYFYDKECLENGEPPEKLIRVLAKTRERYGIDFRQADARRLREDLLLLRDIYKAAWEQNWGFVPPTERELDELFKNLKQYFDVRLGWFGTVKGVEAGFMLGLPDMNQVLHHAYARPGVPEVWTLLKALWHWKIRPKITRNRILLFGVRPEYRRMGVDSAIFFKYLISTSRSPFPIVDAGWVLETNAAVDNQAKMFGAYAYKRYRFYQRSLEQTHG